MNSSIDTFSSRIIFNTINGVSVLVCLLAAILVFGLKLHKKVVYRLALYQVLSSLALSVVWLLSNIDYSEYNDDPYSYGHFCVAIGWFNMYAQWTKLLFTMWVTFHLFCFAVLHKNLKRLEALYVVTSLVVPAVIACVPLTNHSYASSGICYISGPANDSHHVVLIEKVALWNAPAMIILLAASTAMIIMVIKLASSRSQLHVYEPITDGDTFVTALKQLLPLVVFPVLFFIFIIPQLVYDIYTARNPDEYPMLLIVISVFTPMWTFSSGVALLVHISVARYISRKRRMYSSPICLQEGHGSTFESRY